MSKPRFRRFIRRKSRLILLFWSRKSQPMFVAPTVSSDGQRRSSRWERWSLSRAKKDKVASQPNLPASLRGEGVVIVSQPYMLSESGMFVSFGVREGALLICSLLFCCVRKFSQLQEAPQYWRLQLEVFFFPISFITWSCTAGVVFLFVCLQLGPVLYYIIITLFSPGERRGKDIKMSRKGMEPFFVFLFFLPTLRIFFLLFLFGFVFFFF